MRGLPTLLLVATLAGCMEDPRILGDGPADPVDPGEEVRMEADWALGLCQESASLRSPPDLFVLLRDGALLELARLHAVDGSYEVAASKEIFMAGNGAQQKIVPFQGGVITVGGLVGSPSEGLLHLGRDLELVAKTELSAGDAFALGISGTTVLLGNRSLATFDEDLRPLGNVSLPLGPYSSRKAVDQIIVADDFAYLADDIVMPMLSFKVDIARPEAPRVVATASFDGNFIVGEWLDPTADRWVVVGGFGGMGTSSTTAYGFTMSDPASGPVAIPLGGSHTTDFANGTIEWRGHSVMAHTDRVPVWAILEDGGGRSIGPLDIDWNTARIEFCQVSTPLPPGGVGIDSDAHFVAAFAGSTLVVADKASRSMVVTQDIGSDILAVRIAPE